MFLSSLSHGGGLCSHIDGRRCPTRVVSTDCVPASLSSRGVVTTAAFPSVYGSSPQLTVFGPVGLTADAGFQGLPEE
ncbi:hypothetical protein T01_15755 [Trichinella spiralis]|uniref:Uncharacterized protein n=1 Tax=Trichinella spiralis TaxID=6334 RepID=A0A0V1BMT8_TRISP|nr:hypothetical protein T01_15755 [Trichinella spiralis]